jgi:hypothetical protein
MGRKIGPAAVLASAPLGAEAGPILAPSRPENATRRVMSDTDTLTTRSLQSADLSAEERRSLTHGDFWIEDEEREKYKKALSALNRGGVPYVVTGAYAIYEYTGIYRETKDLDLFVEPEHLVSAMRALKE